MKKQWGFSCASAIEYDISEYKDNGAMYGPFKSFKAAQRGLIKKLRDYAIDYRIAAKEVALLTEPDTDTGTHA